MNKIKYTSAVFALFAGLFLTACSDDDNGSENNILSIVDFYPAIVMEGTNLTVLGTDMSDVKEVVFPGGIATSDIVVLDTRTLMVTTPAGISDASEPLIIRNEDSEAQSRQTIRKADPSFKSYLFTTNEGALLKSNMTIQGNDLLLVDKVMFYLNDDTLTIDAMDLMRKSNTDIKFTIPDETPTGMVHLSLIFKNGTELALPDLEVIDGDIPDDFRDPVTALTIMLNDFEVHEGHDPSWCITNTWWNPMGEDGLCAAVIRTDEWDGNSYMYYQKSLGSWILSCDHFDIGVVHNIENYVLKIDVRLDEGVVGASTAAMQVVLGGEWIWMGANYFPESTDGAWITVSRNMSDLKPDWTGDFDIGTKVNGIFGDPIPAGLSIDNLRLDPK